MSFHLYVILLHSSPASCGVSGVVKCHAWKRLTKYRSGILKQTATGTIYRHALRESLFNILTIKLYVFRTVLLSIIRSFSLYTQQWYMSYRFSDSLRAGSGRNSFRPDPARKPYDIFARRYVVVSHNIACQNVRSTGRRYGPRKIRPEFPPDGQIMSVTSPQ